MGIDSRSPVSLPRGLATWVTVQRLSLESGAHQHTSSGDTGNGHGGQRGNRGVESPPILIMTLPIQQGRVSLPEG
jgi:hypothetical protein